MSITKRLSKHHLLTPFQLFKYAFYFILARNIWLFYLEETAAASVMHAGGVAWADFVNVYAATIDTLFWVVLLFLFELETWIIPDDKLTTPIKISFSTLRTICYASILYAFYGYCVTYFELGDWQSIAATGTDLCTRIGNEFMFSIERFTTINTENCASLAITNEFLTNKELMITDSHHFHISWMLAIADVVNAADWILIVLILEAEIWLQTQGLLTPHKLGTVRIFKYVLYSILGIVAVFWGFYGEFIDFWDAFLWIIAFIFIENNVVQWNKETRLQTLATP